MKLFVIGDSLAQGFMSGAAARTDLSFATLIAAKLGLQPGIDFLYPEWPAGGLPVNVEAILRRLYRRYGSSIDAFEWLTVLHTINDVVDEAEDYYERGLGREDVPYVPAVDFFHNVAISGFSMADAWQITPATCQDQLQRADSRPSDGILTGPDSHYYRTALRVLNPSLKPEFAEHSQLRWLKDHAEREGVENVILWLGSNNALGTVIDLKIRQTPNDPNQRPHTLGYIERRDASWNLWHPNDFAAEFDELLDRVESALANNLEKNWRVFLATVPLITIAPLAKGVGEQTHVVGDGIDKGIYYKYYTYVPFEEEFAKTTGTHLTMQEALLIDDSIRAYNATMVQTVAERNGTRRKPHFAVVDIADALRQIAYKRNNGQPTYQFPPEFAFMHPMVNTKYYHADQQGQLKQGGLFSLDGIHPTAIGHGLLAYEFLAALQQAGVVADRQLDWTQIFESDTLYQQPIPIMHQIYGWDRLAEHIIRLIRTFGWRPSLS